MPTLPHNAPVFNFTYNLVPEKNELRTFNKIVVPGKNNELLIIP